MEHLLLGSYIQKRSQSDLEVGQLFWRIWAGETGRSGKVIAATRSGRSIDLLQ
jgi:hypothetical protein